MTDILFINTNDNNQLRSQVNGTMILATKLLAADFSVDILRFCEIEGHDKDDYFKFIDNITDKILSYSPRCVSFYTLWPYYHVLLRIAKTVKDKAPNVIIVMGGPHSSATAFQTMQAMDFVDYISTGAGENTVVPFFTGILRNHRDGIENVPGLYYRKDGKIEFNHTAAEPCDLNAIEHWDDRLYTVEETGLDSDTYFMPLDVGRGCPYSCTFCYTKRFWDRTFRMKSPEKIVEDISYFNKKFGIKSFYFSHDAFTSNMRLVSAVCDRIIESGLDIKWKCTARINCLTEELVLKMKKAGLTHIEFGVETGSDRMQKLINKKLDLEKVKTMTKFLLKSGINVKPFFMYGFPEETEEDLNQTLDLYFDFLDMGVREPSLAYCLFAPSTDMTSKYFDDLYFDPDIKILGRSVRGYAEEAELLKNNKAIFSHYYHLNTTVRDNYQYLTFLGYMYRNFRSTLKLIRRYYKGDNLRLYRDFYNNNTDIFAKDISTMQKLLKENPVQILKNTIKDFDKTVAQHIGGLLEYDYDLQTVGKSKEDVSIQKKYTFDYIAYQMKLPIEQYSDAHTELLIEKKNGRVNVRVVAM